MGNYELLFILWGLVFSIFHFAKNVLHPHKYSHVINSCQNKGELAWPSWHPSGRKWLIPGRNVSGCHFKIIVLIPTSLHTSTFCLSTLTKDNLLFPAGWEVGRKLLNVYARAFQDGAPLGEPRARPTLEFSSHLLASKSFWQFLMLKVLVTHFSEASFTVENKSYGDFTLWWKKGL